MSFIPFYEQQRYFSFLNKLKKLDLFADNVSFNILYQF